MLVMIFISLGILAVILIAFSCECSGGDESFGFDDPYTGEYYDADDVDWGYDKDDDVDNPGWDFP